MKNRDARFFDLGNSALIVLDSSIYCSTLGAALRSHDAHEYQSALQAHGVLLLRLDGCRILSCPLSERRGTDDHFL
jgi:hypothetical protein